LVNRAAGLLLVTPDADPRAHRLQASKAFLAAADARLLARGLFAPSQRERWSILERVWAQPDCPPEFRASKDWIAWAFRYKTDPGVGDLIDERDAWRNAARAILDAVPEALQRAGLRSLGAYARRDGLLDHLVYFRRSATMKGVRRVALHPTARVRVATLRLLEASLDGKIPTEAARQWLGPLSRADEDPVPLLARLRAATLQ
jgi:hypothetical protein